MKNKNYVFEKDFQFQSRRFKIIYVQVKAVCLKKPNNVSHLMIYWRCWLKTNQVLSLKNACNLLR